MKAACAAVLGNSRSNSAGEGRARVSTTLMSEVWCMKEAVCPSQVAWRKPAPARLETILLLHAETGSDPGEGALRQEVRRSPTRQRPANFLPGHPKSPARPEKPKLGCSMRQSEETVPHATRCIAPIALKNLIIKVLLK
jgi:hypothetical protein